MKRVILLLLLLTCLPVACNRGGGENGAQTAKGDAAVRGAGTEAVPVKTARPFRGDVARTIKGTSSIEAKREADVYSRIMGLCQRILVEEGDPVRTGDLLAKLDDEEIRLTLAQATARLGKAKTEHNRAQKLHSDGLISNQGLQEASLQLDLAQADYELTKKRAEDTSIYAPMSGVITDRRVKVGDLVSTTQSIFTILNLESLEAELNVPEQEYLGIHKGQDAKLSIDALPGRAFSGTVARVSPVIDASSGTAQATISVENQDGVLRPGMFARIRVVVEVHENVLLVPKEAILMKGDKKTVFVARDGVAHEVVLTTGFQESDRIEVIEGLNPDDEVIVTGHIGLQDDTKVRIVEDRNG